MTVSWRSSGGGIRPGTTGRRGLTRSGPTLPMARSIVKCECVNEFARTGYSRPKSSSGAPRCPTGTLPPPG